jgi:hypothetical protein
LLRRRGDWQGEVVFTAIARGRIDDRYVGRILPLAFLAPEIVQAIFAGKHPLDLTAKKLIRAIDLPLDWQAQKQVLGFQ